ncbi:helix-turn-helix domain-containing protein [Raoultella ornithinolytica]|nr:MULTISPECIES: helix-turn-helix domain-containing protein [Enterobacterales]EKW7117217.1 helix-turn-helix domain-containing protein [Raoultella ornithinolytica]MCE1517152.1 helix-turn-helix domain-containing protein [Enterobacter hormaechei]HCI6825933.1 helix-turn-helix domain-containing protein [Klebsiella variicola subsp. variicola]HCM9424283.1 helix-turn-helix domain-containing protein [Enterobacter asburiae]HDS7134903.1 helix-turn-helix domain-containing protein [Klebsiella aerogenes]
MSPDNVFFKGLELWVRENVTRKITLQEVASRYGYSKWYLNRSYMLYSGISLGAFIRLERMKAAADDLINSGNRIMDIALRYEFESQQTFTRAFSRHYGMPPATFRKVMRNRQSPDRKHS